jgi:tellurite resistance protein
LFGIPFGIAGLADVWATARPVLGTSVAVADSLHIMAGAAWVLILAIYAAQGPRRILTDLRDPVVGAFTSLAVITPTLLSAALAPYAFDAARILVAVFLALTMLLGSWITGQWIVGPVDQDTAHPGYFLPTTASGLIAAYAGAQVNLHAVAEASFGIGILSWVIFGSLLLNRLFFRPMLPTPLVPTLAIEVAPPVVAGLAYFAIFSDRIDAFATVLAGYAVLMGLVQLRLAPLYLKLHFSPAMWTFAFSYAAAATYALLWIRIKNPPGAAAYAAVTVGLITFFIGAIAVFTVAALVRGTFVPKPTMVVTRTPASQDPHSPVPH